MFKMEKNKTRIEDILDSDEFKVIVNSELDDNLSIDELEKIILDFSSDQRMRLHAIDKLFVLKNDDLIEIVSRLCGMFTFSGSRVLEDFLYGIIYETKVTSFLKLESVKGLLSFEEEIETINENDDEKLKEIKKDSNEKIIYRNEKRQNSSYEALKYICSTFDSFLASPCKVDALFILMEKPKYKEDALAYFIEFTNQLNIDIDFRYKAILSLEMKKDLKYSEKYKISSEDREYYMQHTFLAFNENDSNSTTYRTLAGQYLLQKLKLDAISSKKVQMILLGFAKDETLDMNLRADAADCLLNLGSLEIKDEARHIIMTLGRMLGGIDTVYMNAQNVHTNEVEESVKEILGILTSIPTMKIDNVEVDVEYVISQIKKLIEQDKKIFIDQMQEIMKKKYPEDFFVNYIDEEKKQDENGNKDEKDENDEKDEKYDVDDVDDVKDDVDEKDHKDDVDDVKDDVKDDVDENDDVDNSTSTLICKFCKLCYKKQMIQNIKEKTINECFYCDEQCFIHDERYEKMNVSLNRIQIDRILYSKYAQTLSNILIKVYTYIMESEHKNEMLKRLLEELNETAHTCSSGYATRLCNCISGFGDVSIRISFVDQLVSNFIGRMNARARNICDKKSIYYKEKHRDVVILYMKEKNLLNNKFTPEELKNKDTLDSIVNKYLKKDKRKKIALAVENFSDNVLLEMTDSSNYDQRPNFIKFFRDNLLTIRDELYQEFKQYMTDSEFDLSIRKAISEFEGFHFIV
jgi:hypothetical protein